MFLKTLLLSALALLTPGGAVMNQNANSDGVDLPRSNAVNSYVPMSSHADLDMHKALNTGGSELKNSRSPRTNSIDVISIGSCGKKLQYMLADQSSSLQPSLRVLTISGSGKMDNYADTSDSPWYGYRKSIDKIVIEDGVDSIGNNAFYGCTNLKSVEIADSVDSIGDYAFWDCESLSKVVIPKGADIGNDAFLSCKSLSKVVIPEGGIFSSVSIGDHAFCGCESLTSIGPMGSGASVEIPDNVNSIGVGVFAQCTSLSKVVIPDSLKSIGGTAFVDCTSLTSIGPTGSGASVEIPDSIDSIGGYAFHRCTGLRSVEIPSSVTKIDVYAFELCTSLRSVVISSKGGIFSSPSIGEGAFFNCTNLESVKISGSVTSIELHAFYGCTSLSNVKYCGTSSPSFGEDVFKNCPVLSSVKVPEDYKEDTFCAKPVSKVLDDNCIGPNEPSDSSVKPSDSSVKPSDSSVKPSDSSVKPSDSSVKPGDSSVKPGDSSDVKTCDGITYKLYDGTLKISGNGEMCSYDNKEAYPWYESKDNVKEIIIEGNIKSIGVNAFNGYKNLEKVSIADTVSSIGEFAFKDCTNLTEVSYCGENKISTENVFNGCSKLNAVDVSKDYKYDEFGGKPVEKELECHANNVPNPESTNAAGSTSVISTALGVATAALVLNNRRYIP